MTTTTGATIAVADELVSLCRAGRNDEAIKKLYSDRIVSVEPVGNEQMPAEVRGIEAVRAKNDWWTANNEVNSAEVNGPFIGDEQFAVQYTWDVTFKPTGERIKNTEMALYTVQDGKIVREQFFYHMPGM